MERGHYFPLGDIHVQKNKDIKGKKCIKWKGSENERRE